MLSAGLVQVHLGRLVNGRRHLEEARAICDALEDPGALVPTFAMSPAILARGYLGLAYWMLGDSGAARQTSDEAVAIATRRHQHEYSLSSALVFNTWIHLLAGDTAMVGRRLQQLQSNNVGVQESALMTKVLAAWARAQDDDTAIDEARRALARLAGGGFNLWSSLYLGFLVDAYLRAGHPEAAIAAADQALAQADATGEQIYEAALCRLRGEAAVARCRSATEEAEVWLQRAIAVADRQQAVWLREQAEASLSRLGKPHYRAS